MTDELREQKLLVKQMTWEAEAVLSLALEHPEREGLYSWAPGAHVDLCLPNGIVRQYSLCGDPDDQSSYRLAVLREPISRGGSSAVHELVRPGDVVVVRGPRNNFQFLPAERYLFIAGGIGVTPLLPMMATAERSGAEWRLLYGGRRRSSMAFLEEVKRYGDRAVIAPEDERGLLDLDAWLSAPQPGAKVYCCGPEGLLTAVEDRCRAWPADCLQVERFAPKPGIIHPGDSEREFDVSCDRSGLTVHVPPDVSILEALRAAGVDVPSSCEEGICGTCETRVIEGTPDHRDSILSDTERAENTNMMICVSRAFSDQLVLDR